MVVTVACGQTDAGITTSVKSRLAADDTVKAYQVNVDTQNHVVTLSGDLETAAAKDRALAIARETDGVRDVIDQLRVEETAATSGVSGDVNVDRNTAEEIGDATVEGAKKAGRATATGAKKVGGAIRDAVTDNDRDSDKDGK
jgi:hypothetical protein